uniref:Uncharacterized protein n=1 Tax=Myotis myotis TaxID=51298 RepID=A0A7J7XZY1_MYOMY|nr:hypothetical protein mMyoMyo1_011463 [Myotis myotis]
MVIMMCLGVGLFGFTLFGTLWACVTFFFPTSGKFSDIISSNRFSNPCSSFCCSGTPIIRMLFRFMLSQSSLRLSSCLFIFFSNCSTFWVCFASLSSKSLIRSSASPSLLLILSMEFFIAAISLFISSWVLLKLLIFSSVSSSFFHMLSIFSSVSSSFFHMLLIFSSVSSCFLLRLSIFSSIRFMHSRTLILNSFSVMLHASVLLSCFSGESSFSFLWGFLCLPMFDLTDISRR